MRTLLTFVTFFFSANLLAAPTLIMCEKDGRPYDGGYHSIGVELNDENTFDVVLRTASPRFPFDVETTTVLAKNIDEVNFDGEELVAVGHRAATAGESQNSGFEFKKVVETSISHSGQIYSANYLAVSVYSPIVAEMREELGISGNVYEAKFSIVDRFSRGCFSDAEESSIQ